MAAKRKASKRPKARRASPKKRAMRKGSMGDSCTC